MKVLIICSSDNNTKIIASVTEAWEKHEQTDGRRLKASADKKKEASIVVLKSQDDYNKAYFEDGKPDFVFVQNTLYWNKHPVSGYEICLDLILHKLKNHFFNIQFISLDRQKDLIRSVDVKYKKLVQTFHHLSFSNLKKEISFEKNLFSPLHFELVKSLALNDDNRISVIQHEIDNIREDVEDLGSNSEISQLKSDLQSQLDELSLLKFIASEKIQSLQRNLAKANKKESLKKNIADLENIINDAKEQLSSSTNEEYDKAKKLNYKVLIIEDSLKWRTFFSNTFSEMYQTVYPGNQTEIQKFEIAKAKEIIKSKKDSNIFVLDLLYKDENEIWYPFNGLDLYQFVKEQNPYACIRIITSLPRDIVSKISGLLLKTEIKLSHVFTKKVGEKRLKFGIYDRALEINIECRENEKRKTAYKPIPTEGIFKWEGVRDYIYNLMKTKDEKFVECWQKAFSFIELYHNSKLNKKTPNWDNGSLPSPQMKKKSSNAYVLEKLPNILAHRLLVIKNSVENKNRLVDIAAYETKVLSKISTISACDTGYLHTKLGFNCKLYNGSFEIQLKNLFPEEVLFISEIEKQANKKVKSSLKEYPKLQKWFYAILSSLDVYENWEALSLNFFPYLSDDEISKTGTIANSNLATELSIEHLEYYLRALVRNSLSEVVQKIIDQTTESYLNLISHSDENEIPDYILCLIDDLWDET